MRENLKLTLALLLAAGVTIAQVSSTTGPGVTYTGGSAGGRAVTIAVCAPNTPTGPVGGGCDVTFAASGNQTLLATLIANCATTVTQTSSFTGVISGASGATATLTVSSVTGPALFFPLPIHGAGIPSSTYIASGSGVTWTIINALGTALSNVSAEPMTGVNPQPPLCFINFRVGDYHFGATVPWDRSFVVLNGEQNLGFWGSYNAQSWNSTQNIPTGVLGIQNGVNFISDSCFGSLLQEQDTNIPDGPLGMTRTNALELRHRDNVVRGINFIGCGTIPSIGYGTGAAIDFFGFGDNNKFENIFVQRWNRGFQGTTDDGYFTHFECQDDADYCIFMAGSNSTHLTDVTAYDTNGGIRLAADHSTLKGCVVGDQFNQDSIQIVGSYNTVTGCTLQANGGTAATSNMVSIYPGANGGAGNSIEDNTFDLNSGQDRVLSADRASAVQSHLGGTCSQGTIAHNTFKACNNSAGGCASNGELAGVYAIDVSADSCWVVEGNNIGPGFNNNSTTSINPGTGNLLANNLGDIHTPVGQPSAPSAGFGTGATLTLNTGPEAFTINVGTTPSSSGTITLPAALTGWNCKGSDDTTTTEVLDFSASTTTQITITGYLRTTGAATNFTASDKLRVSCRPN